jgi:hypothetical protein
MDTAAGAPHFWSAVEDCLVTFHQLARAEAAEMVTNLWRRLPTALDGANRGFEDMIYHAEPWQIACNLAERDLPIAEHQAAYHALLVRNGLLTHA